MSLHDEYKHIVGTEIHRKAAVGNAWLMNVNYWAKLLEKISGAKHEILTAQYVINYQLRRRWHPSSKIVNALIKKNSQEVPVKVLLDSSPKTSPNHNTNFFTSKRLTEAGIEVKMPAFQKPLHIKLTIIDGITVFLGSHNITDSSLTNPLECTTIFTESETGQYFQHFFNNLWTTNLTKPWERR